MKHLILDLDGVVVIPPKKFSDKLSEDFNISSEKIIPFFQKEFQLCCLGKADLKRSLEKYMGVWKSHKTVDDLLKYWFESENYPNTELLGYIEEIRRKGIKVHVVSNQEKLRTKFIKDEMGLKKYFNTFFISADLGVKKPDREFYQKVFKVLQKDDPDLLPEEITYWDDEEKNVDAGTNFGFNSNRYVNYPQLQKVMDQMI